VVPPGPTCQQKEMLYLWTLLSTRPDLAAQMAAVPKPIETLDGLPADFSGFAWPNLDHASVVLPILNAVYEFPQTPLAAAFVTVRNYFANTATGWESVAGHPTHQECSAIFTAGCAPTDVAKPVKPAID